MPHSNERTPAIIESGKNTHLGKNEITTSIYAKEKEGEGVDSTFNTSDTIYFDLSNLAFEIGSALLLRLML